MSDWIHCNKCFKQPTPNSDKFNLTNCGHFVCATCTSEKPGYCFECESNCTTTVLTPNLSDDIYCYFENIDVQFNQIKKCLKVMEFQKNHRQKFFTHIYEEHMRCTKELKNVLFKYNAAKEYIKKINRREEDLVKENKRLHSIIKNNMKESKSYANNSAQDRTNSHSGHRGIKKFAMNPQTPTNDSTPASRNHSFFSDNLRNNTYSSNASSMRPAFFATTPSPAINLPFQSLFLNSNGSCSSRK